MVNYGKGLIYKLCCNDTDIKDEYVGSTTDFTERKRTHKVQCNNPNSGGYHFKVYQFIRNNGGFENWSMIQIEKFPCESKRELETRERYWIETLESKLNCVIPTRTDKEWCIDNSDKIKEYQKVYRIQNVDKIKEYQIEWRIENSNILKELKHLYYVKNSYNILERQKEKITCECGSIVNKHHLQRHCKTNKHLKLLEEKLK